MCCIQASNMEASHLLDIAQIQQRYTFLELYNSVVLYVLDDSPTSFRALVLQKKTFHICRF